MCICCAHEMPMGSDREGNIALLLVWRYASNSTREDDQPCPLSRKALDGKRVFWRDGLAFVTGLNEALLAQGASHDCCGVFDWGNVDGG